MATTTASVSISSSDLTPGSNLSINASSTLMKTGLTTAIVNSYDKELMAICNGDRQSDVDMVYGMMEGNDPDPSTLSGVTLEHYKTYKVLSGQILFSESWLEL